MTPAIKIIDLKKSYDDTVALKGINVTINDGSFFGLLGPNGAGKTTTINILTGLVNKDSGHTQVFGMDTEKDYRYTRSKIGISAQEFSQDWFFNLEQLLFFQAGYFGIRKKDAKHKVDELFLRLGLEEKRNSRLRQLSGGMKRRFQIAKALVHDPQIIILDEPTAGVDVELRHELWEYFKELHNDGKTILLTTHYIEEAEKLCDMVSIINNGEVMTKGSPKELMDSQGKSGITIHLSESNTNLKKFLKGFTYTQEDTRLHFTIRDPEGVLPNIIQCLAKAGSHISSIETSRSSLEDVFLSLTGKGINE
ncbi:MAG: ABC transporter ATP-binding protein [Flavobacteriaceae bacterium TMED121]|nr:ABC transporter ATP-binding protein [Candidatus Neomarinimicrobiota bacterium]RPG67088.1 MAG: ABC transporter ATP-binding protein [Flavobacteriaceae bacterium TMED121]